MNSTANFNTILTPNSISGVISIFTLIISFLSIFANAFLFFLLHNSPSFHSNVRFLLKHFTFSAVLLSIVLIYRSIYNISIWINRFNQISLLFCLIHEIPWDLTSSTVTISISFIGLERVITTIWKKEYFDFARPSILVYFMVSSTWIVSFLTMLIGNSVTLIHSPLVTPYCFCSLSVPASIIYLVCALYFLIDIGTLTCYCILFYQSKSAYFDWTINTSQHSLAQRHQLLDNMQTTKLLTPILLTHGATYIAIACLTFYAAVRQNVTIAFHCAVATYTLQSIDNIINPILIMCRHEKTRQSALQYLPFLKPFENKNHAGTIRVITIGRGQGEMGNHINRQGIVEYRMEPENHQIILHNLWNQKEMRNSRMCDVPGRVNHKRQDE